MELFVNDVTVHRRRPLHSVTASLCVSVVYSSLNVRARFSQRKKKHIAQGIVFSYIRIKCNVSEHFLLTFPPGKYSVSAGVILRFNTIRTDMSTDRSSIRTAHTFKSIYIRWPSTGRTNKRKLNCINPINAELIPNCQLLALLGTHHILHVSRIRVNTRQWIIRLALTAFCLMIILL